MFVSLPLNACYGSIDLDEILSGGILFPELTHWSLLKDTNMYKLYKLKTCERTLNLKSLPCLSDRILLTP